MLDFASAFNRPLSNLQRSGLQAVLSIFPFSYIAFPWIWGYLYQCIVLTLEGDESLPEWIGPVDLLKNGLMTLLVTIAYMVPGALVILIAFGGENPLTSTTGTSLTLLTIGTALFALAAYLLGAAIMNAAADMGWGHAFALREVTAVAFTIRYLKAFCAACALNLLVLGIIYWIGTWSFLPVTAGIIIFGAVSAILGAYSGIVTMTLLAQAYHD